MGNLSQLKELQKQHDRLVKRFNGLSELSNYYSNGTKPDFLAAIKINMAICLIRINELRVKIKNFKFKR